MPRKPKRYPLLLYERMLKRWISATFWLAVFVTGFGAAAWFYAPQFSDFNIYLLLGAGAFAFLVTLILFLIRKSAYLQLYPDYLRIVTPFMRVKVNYKSIKRTNPAEMGNLFSMKKVRGMRREIVAPFMKHTAIVLNLSAYPMAPWILRCFSLVLFLHPQGQNTAFHPAGGQLARFQHRPGEQPRRRDPIPATPAAVAAGDGLGPRQGKAQEKEKGTSVRAGR